MVLPDNEDEFTIDVLYNLLCRNESAAKPLPVRAKEVVAQYLADGRESDIDHIPAGEFIAPGSIDFTHGRYICIDGLYYAYLLIPSDGYKTHVPAGWLSLMVHICEPLCKILQALLHFLCLLLFSCRQGFQKDFPFLFCFLPYLQSRFIFRGTHIALPFYIFPVQSSQKLGDPHPYII